VANLISDTRVGEEKICGGGGGVSVEKTRVSQLVLLQPNSIAVSWCVLSLSTTFMLIYEMKRQELCYYGGIIIFFVFKPYSDEGNIKIDLKETGGRTWTGVM